MTMLDFLKSFYNPSDLKEVDQVTFEGLIASYSTHTVSFSDYLYSNGYSSTIKNINVHFNGDNSNINFSGCSFFECDFKGDFSHYTFDQVYFDHSTFHEVNFTGATFDLLQFNHSTFHEANFSGTTFHKTFINDCEFNDSVFLQASYYDNVLYDNTMSECDFSNSSFYLTEFGHTVFINSELNNAFDYQCHLDNVTVLFDQNYTITDYVFKDASFVEAISKISIMSDPVWYSTPHLVLINSGVIPVSISKYDANIDPQQLDYEVKQVLASIEMYGLEAPSIAQQILNSNLPTVQLIKQKAYLIMQESDALWLTGGPDIHAELYGQKPHSLHNTSPDYYREIYEFALTEASLELGKPILGVCHGMQLVNIYFGGTLLQHVEGHYDIEPELNVLTHEGHMGSIIVPPMYGPSYHHQAVDAIGDSLEIVCEYDGVIKALQSDNADIPIFLCQFHPEYLIDQNSHKIIDKFIELSSQPSTRSQVLTVEDVLQQNEMIFDDNATTVVAHEPVALTEHYSIPVKDMYPFEQGLDAVQVEMI